MGILYGPLAAYSFSFLWSPSFKMVILILVQGLKVVVNAMWSQLPVWKVGVLEECSDFILMERDCSLDSDFCLCLEILHFAMAPVWGGHHSHCLSCSTRLEMGKWMEDLNMAIEMAKKSTEKSDTLLDNSVCNRSNSKRCFLPSWNVSGIESFSFFLL